MKSEKQSDTRPNQDEDLSNGSVCEKRMKEAERIRQELSGREHSDSAELLREMREERG